MRLPSHRAFREHALISPACPLSTSSSASTLKDISSSVSSVVSATASRLLPDAAEPSDASTRSFLSRHSTSPPHVLSFAFALHSLSPSSLDSTEAVLFQLLSPQLPSCAALEAAVGALTLLDRAGSSRAEEFREEAKKRWPESACFGTADERTAKKEAWLAAEKERADKGARQGEAN